MAQFLVLRPGQIYVYCHFNCLLTGLCHLNIIFISLSPQSGFEKQYPLLSALLAASQVRVLYFLPNLKTESVKMYLYPIATGLFIIVMKIEVSMLR